MYKALLVHVDTDDANSVSRVQLAAHLARQFHAVLIGAAALLPEATIEILASGGAAVAIGAISADPHELDERFARARSLFEQWTNGLEIETRWRTAVQFPAQALATMAAGADLLIAGPRRKSSPANSYLDYGHLVMQAGRPVLIVPEGASTLGEGAAVVAWRNTRESRRALADALPFLAAATGVTLIHVGERSDDPDEAASLADAQALLSAHGISASVETISAGRASPARAIVDFAVRSQAQLIVAGAYGHTRMREWAFGGVTQDMLEGVPVACLFSR